MSEAQANKYLEWSKEDLIKRILELEKYVFFFFSLTSSINSLVPNTI